MPNSLPLLGTTYPTCALAGVLLPNEMPLTIALKSTHPHDMRGMRLHNAKGMQKRVHLLNAARTLNRVLVSGMTQVTCMPKSRQLHDGTSPSSTLNGVLLTDMMQPTNTWKSLCWPDATGPASTLKNVLLAGT
jgi:hypothetical protein